MFSLINLRFHLVISKDELKYFKKNNKMQKGFDKKTLIKGSLQQPSFKMSVFIKEKLHLNTFKLEV